MPGFARSNSTAAHNSTAFGDVDTLRGFGQHLLRDHDSYHRLPNWQNYVLRAKAYLQETQPPTEKEERNTLENPPPHNVVEILEKESKLRKTIEKTTGGDKAAIEESAAASYEKRARLDELLTPAERAKAKKPEAKKRKRAVQTILA